jgi:hypothetical protein
VAFDGLEDFNDNGRKRLTLAGFIVALAAVPLLQEAKSADSDEEYEHISVAVLIRGAKDYDYEAIRELGRRKVAAAIPVLRKVARADIPPEPQALKTGGQDRKEAYEHQRSIDHIENIRRSQIYAKVSLAQLGDEAALDEFIVGLSSTSLPWRAKCIAFLATIHERKTVRYLIPLLDDNRMPYPPGRDMSSDSIAGCAERALDQILPEVTEDFKKSTGKRCCYSEQWKQWWKANRAGFEYDRQSH